MHLWVGHKGTSPENADCETHRISSVLQAYKDLLELHAEIGSHPACESPQSVVQRVQNRDGGESRNGT